MKYYSHTSQALKRITILRYGVKVPKRDRSNMPAHIMWMLQEMQIFPDTRKGSAKAGRWIGWIFRDMERDGLREEARSLKELKQDVKEGNW